MIQAQRSRWALFIFDIYLNRLMRKYFSRFYVVNSFPDLPADAGLIVTPNHFSWWDGFFAYYALKRYTRRNIYLMMLEDQLSHYRFFRKVGAYSLNPGNPVSIARTISYTREIVSDPAKLAIVFPQGEIEPYDKRPPELKKGISFIAKSLRPDTNILPLACKIQYDNLKTPYVAIRFGIPLTAGAVHTSFQQYEREFSIMLDELDRATKEKLFLHNLFTST
jgi:1-acyl-sn-glycerol-3-phosphate acyltransferase